LSARAAHPVDVPLMLRHPRAYPMERIVHRRRPAIATRSQDEPEGLDPLCQAA
jgi:hypothetical protein